MLYDGPPCMYRAINNYLDQRSFEHLDVCPQMSGMHGSIFGCIYLFQFGHLCQNSAKQATALYVHSLKTISASRFDVY
jgi:hypothetical protein